MAPLDDALRPCRTVRVGQRVTLAEEPGLAPDRYRVVAVETNGDVILEDAHLVVWMTGEEFDRQWEAGQGEVR